MDEQKRSRLLISAGERKDKATCAVSYTVSYHLLNRFFSYYLTALRLRAQQVDQEILTHGLGERRGWMMIPFERLDSRTNKRGVFSTGC